ncbi:MAG: hypothetical protein NVSMB65_08520 [Chloroflexota bacterium]
MVRGKGIPCTLVIFAEKVLPGSRRIGKLVAVALVAYGALVAAVPAALPTVM